MNLTCFSVLFVLFSLSTPEIDGATTPPKKPTFWDEVDKFTVMASDLSRGDFVGALDVFLGIIQNKEDLNLLMKIAIQITRKILELIHPIIVKLNPSIKDRGNMGANLSAGLGNLGSMIRLFVKS